VVGAGALGGLSPLLAGLDATHPQRVVDSAHFPPAVRLRISLVFVLFEGGMSLIGLALVVALIAETVV
jgi:hypothetical protein